MVDYPHKVVRWEPAGPAIACMPIGWGELTNPPPFLSAMLPNKSGLVHPSRPLGGCGAPQHLRQELGLAP
jgi:hypothetical protein